MSKYNSKNINHFQIGNDIKSIRGNFVYRKFEPFEQIDEKLENRPEYVDINDIYPDLTNVPRYVELFWEGDFLSLLPGEIPIQNVNLEQGVNIFFSTDLLRDYAVYTTAEREDVQTQNELISDSIEEVNKLDYLLSQAGANKFTESIEDDLLGVAGVNSSVPVIEETTNKPVTLTQVLEGAIQAPDIFLHTPDLKGIVNTSYRSPYTGEGLDKEKNRADTLQNKALNRNLELVPSSISASIINAGYLDNLVSTASGPVTNNLFSNKFVLVGYAMLKYRMVEGNKQYMYTRFIDAQEYRDPYVAYGQTYRYELHPTYARYTDGQRLIFLVSDESSFIDINCTETKVPSPPDALKFEYVLGNKIRASWDRPSSFVTDDERSWEVNDIKGYQILQRHSLRESYQLVKYFTFNNTEPRVQRMYAKEIIPDDYIISTEIQEPIRIDRNGAPIYFEPLEYILSIRPNVDYFMTMCSIDAHGNSSNYGTQYKIRRNNVTGEVDIRVISHGGAPKQYPNLYIPGKLVKPSMLVSGYKHLDIYYAPDTKHSKPNYGKDAFNLQLFELETQSEQNIKIKINDRSKDTN